MFFYENPLLQRGLKSEFLPLPTQTVGLEALGPRCREFVVYIVSLFWSCLVSSDLKKYIINIMSIFCRLAIGYEKALVLGTHVQELDKAEKKS
jgi:hypothetical protein